MSASGKINDAMCVMYISLGDAPAPFAPSICGNLCSSSVLSYSHPIVCGICAIAVLTISPAGVFPRIVIIAIVVTIDGIVRRASLVILTMRNFTLSEGLFVAVNTPQAATTTMTLNVAAEVSATLVCPP